eukprot:gb/GECH01011758.1/.p1 GENE.gb/GECH01011758.1/~~gb/GECH01011758.1/.p1  ORF type:complete len:226 (+),score=62.84 gb/GECH01011758.1/:1-678(+)
MADMQSFHDELEESYSKLTNEIEKYKQTEVKHKSRSIMPLQQLYREIKQRKRQFDIELREQPSEDQRYWKQKKKEHEAKIGKFKNEIAWIQQSDLTGQESTTTAQQESKPETPQDLLHETKNVQQESLASVQRSERIAAKTEQVGAETASRLEEDRERIQAIDDNLTELEANVKRARKEVTSFARRVATDKIILIVVCIVVVLIAVVIVLAIVLKGDGGNIDLPF